MNLSFKLSNPLDFLGCCFLVLPPHQVYFWPGKESHTMPVSKSGLSVSKVSPLTSAISLASKLFIEAGLNQCLCFHLVVLSFFLGGGNSEVLRVYSWLTAQKFLLAELSIPGIKSGPIPDWLHAR